MGLPARWRAARCIRTYLVVASSPGGLVSSVCWLQWVSHAATVAASGSDNNSVGGVVFVVIFKRLSSVPCFTTAIRANTMLTIVGGLLLCMPLLSVCFIKSTTAATEGRENTTASRRGAQRRAGPVGP